MNAIKFEIFDADPNQSGDCGWNVDWQAEEIETLDRLKEWARSWAQGSGEYKYLDRLWFVVWDGCDDAPRNGWFFVGDEYESADLAQILSEAIEAEDTGMIDRFARYVEQDLVAIETDDESPESLDDTEPQRLWVTSDHVLRYDGNEVAEWTRCSCGNYDNGGDWSVDEDTAGGDAIPEAVAHLLDLIGIEDYIPDVPEPPQATEQYTEDEDGEY